MGKGSKNFDHPSGVDDEQQQSSMLTTSNPILSVNDNGKQQFTWEEIRRNSNAKNRWIVIDNRVYDVSRWLKHPGGQAVLKHYSGQDASEAFHALHPNVAYVEKYMKTYYIGDLKKDSIDQDQALKDDFEKLRQKAIRQNLFKPSILFFILTGLHILAFEFAAYFTLFKFGTGWLPYILAIIFYVTAEAQCGWIQHDFGHLSVFKTSTWNHLVHQFFIGFTKGASADWWNHMHFQHHSKPNVIDVDPDTRVEPIFVLGDILPRRAAERNAKYGKQLPYNLQHLYFFIAAPLLFPVYFQFMTIRHAVKRRKWMDCAWLFFYYFKYFTIMPFALGFVGALKFHFIIRVFEGTWFVIVTQSNHVVMEIAPDDSKLGWFRMQLKATCNIEKSFFNDWFTGHLNFQIEHHLFPMMPRHNLYKIQPDVIDLCRKYDIPYIVKPIGQAFYDIITSLEKSGRMWRDTYEELINASNTLKSNT